MADDCRGSEEETGASRQNILKFLSPPSPSSSTGISLDTRRRLLESGDHTDVEDVFREEFLGVINPTQQSQNGQSKGISKDEKMTILKLVIPLSTVTGRNATTPTVGRVSNLITDLVPPGSQAKEVQPVVQLFNSFISSLSLSQQDKEKQNLLDPRLPIVFFAKHGQAITQLALGNDMPSRKMVEGLKVWSEESLRRWKERDMNVEVDVEVTREKVVKQILPALLASTHPLSTSASKAFTYNRTLEKAGEMFEILFYTVYLFSTNPTDSRTAFIPPYAQDQLRTLAQHVFALSPPPPRARNTATGPGRPDAMRWGVVRDLLEVTSSPRKPLFAGPGIVPTWKSQIQPHPLVHPQLVQNQSQNQSQTQMRRPPPQGPRASVRGEREREFESPRDRGQRQYPPHLEPRRGQTQPQPQQMGRDQDREKERETKEERHPGGRPATPPLPAPPPTAAAAATIAPVPPGINIRPGTTTSAGAAPTPMDGDGDGDGRTNMSLSINGANKRRREGGVGSGSDSARLGQGDGYAEEDGGARKKKGRNDKDGKVDTETSTSISTSTSTGTVGAGAALLARMTGGGGRLHTPPTMAQPQAMPLPQHLKAQQTKQQQQQQRQQQQPKLSLRDRLGPSITSSPAHNEGHNMSALDRLALGGKPTSSPAAAGSGTTSGANKPAQPNTLTIAGHANTAQAQAQVQAQSTDTASQRDDTGQASISKPKSIKIRRDNRPAPTTLFHRNYSSNGGNIGREGEGEKEEEEDEPVVRKGRGFVAKEEDVVMFEPPKEGVHQGTRIRQSGGGGYGNGVQGVWRANASWLPPAAAAQRGRGGAGPGLGMARGMLGTRDAAARR
uniref:Uncharacterized protein n=1 Tax=Cryptococcus bacillisporus CA1280 TaxID=1296109 RepID=A0A0D0TRJ4_CRYGA|nr:hypothetical protein I312_01497 [Cryptococcus bacillisporus CA1280]